MRRGDICIADLDPHIGSEASKLRPVVVVSNNGANIAARRSGRGVVMVVPLTLNTEQVRCVSPLRLGPVLATLPARSIERLDSALRLHLDL